MKIYGEHDEATLTQLKVCGGDHAVLCADGHKGYSQPVGGVVAYADQISVSGVGFDIGCGNLAVRTDMTHKEIKPRIEKIMDQVVETISFGMGRKNKEPVDHELFDSDTWNIPTIKRLKETARQQLGTVGGGNHYVDIFVDEADEVWVGVHFGSRGFGHKTATAFLHRAGGRDGMDVPPALLDAQSEAGQEYIASMTLAGEYAYAGREWVARQVVRKILGAKVVEEVHNHHNYAWRETHFGKEYWVVRKGATPAFPGQRGFVGGSMGDNAVIIEGVDSEDSREALYSTVHGAGRVMSRTAARGHRNKAGLVNKHAMLAWIRNKGVVLRGADLDEAPQCYRRLDEVLAAHAGTIRILHTLRPIGVAMAGPEIKDPYRD